MRLYTLTGATALEDPEFGKYEADEQGGFDFPNELSSRLHNFHVGGKPAWEDDIERQQRLMTEELERRKDPATLLDAVQQIVMAAQNVAAGQQAGPTAGGGDGDSSAPNDDAKGGDGDGQGDGDVGDGDQGDGDAKDEEDGDQADTEDTGGDKDTAADTSAPAKKTAKKTAKGKPSK
ncbi:hypothetical protein [Streptomyces sp. NPDC005302]|uniref:hypothetical protein n=1 Tax=Streptomyces sp. NPDC005302 TaxID=3154675 RepID=UPI0033A43D80